MPAEISLFQKIQMRHIKDMEMLAEANKEALAQAHGLVGIFEFGYRPSSAEVSGKDYFARAVIGRLSCKPLVQIADGTLLVQTHGYYEVPDLRTNFIPPTLITEGSMCPEWANYRRLTRHIEIPKSYMDVVAPYPHMHPETTQLVIGFGTKEVVNILMHTASQINYALVPDLHRLNTMLLHTHGKSEPSPIFQ